MQADLIALLPQPLWPHQEQQASYCPPKSCPASAACWLRDPLPSSGIASWACPAQPGVLWRFCSFPDKASVRRFMTPG